MNRAKCEGTGRGLLAVLIFLVAPPTPAEAPFRRGDMNGDGRLDISDPVALLHYLFLGDTGASCLDAGDADDDGTLNITDAIYPLAFLFTGGPAPPPPFLECGSDPTPDPLLCEQFDPCPSVNDGLVRARVISQVVWPLEEGELSGFTAEELETLSNDGVEITAGALRSKALPLSGTYLEMDGARHMLSREGYLTLKDPGVLTAVKVYWQVTDEAPGAVIDLLKVAPADVEPPETFLELSYRPPPDMNAGATFGEGGIAAIGDPCPLPTAIDGCPLRTLGPGCPSTNAVPCCEDYLGPFGDGTPRWRYTNPNFPNCPVDTTCTTRAYRNFVGSKCYEWVFNRRGKPCFPETLDIGPACWVRHKYRNCQNMDEDMFTLTASPASVKFGEKVRLIVVNNTAANSTRLRIEPNAGKGDLKLAPGTPPVTLERDGGGWRLDHWNDGRKEHYEGVALEYETPQRDATGKCVATYSIIAEADGLEKKVEVRVIPKRNAWRGSTKRTQITDTAGAHNEIITTAQVFFDNDAGTVSGTTNFTETQTAEGCVLTVASTVPITARADTYLRVDFVPDPPTVQGEGASDFSPKGSIECPGGSAPVAFELPNDGWLNTVLGGRQFYTSSDGCQCQGTNDTGVFGSSQITYEWDLRKVLDP